MAQDRLLTEIERQQKYLDGLPKDFTFPLFNAKHAIESQRKSGYRDSAAASREIVDNSIEAGAEWIDIIFKKGRNVAHEVVTAVAFIDNGSGMLPEMARYGLSWGGGTHFDDPDFIGKFGFGLPNASINQTRLVEVYTRTSRDKPFVKATLDIDQYTEYGLQKIPEPIDAKLPDFVQSHLKRKKITLDHGTVVVWVKPDRLTYKTPAVLKDHLVDDFAVTYRYLLARGENPISLEVEGVRVEPDDPLFLNPWGRFYRPEEEGGAIKVTERFIPIVRYLDQEAKEVHLKKVENESEIDENDPNLLSMGTIHITVARFPYGFVEGTKKKGEKTTDAHRRFEIRKGRRGMSFVRAGREIETYDAFPKSASDVASGLGRWPLLQSYAYHWGIEVRFDPQLDDVFGITNDKQSVRPAEDFWRVLHKEGIDDLLSAEQAWQQKKRHDENNKIKEKEAQASHEPTPAETAARNADVAGTTKPKVPDYARGNAKSLLESVAKERANITKKTIDEVLEAMRKEEQHRPYKIDYFEDENSPFFEPEWIGSQIVIKINKKHPFFVYGYGLLFGSGNGRPIKEAIDLLLITLGKGELTAREQDLALWYQTQRKQVWSPYLATAMLSLGQKEFDSEDEQMEGEVV